MKKLLQEFKAFAMKGSVIDMAVGIIIGGGFGKVVASLVSDVIMPPIGLLIGGVNFTELKAVLNPNSVKEGVEAVTLNYGTFIQTIIDFTIIAFSIFMVIRLINKLHNLTKKKEEEVQAAPPAAPEPTKEEILLTEIRDLLKSKN
jgi:large conductance mechanosensitive channel